MLHFMKHIVGRFLRGWQDAPHVNRKVLALGAAASGATPSESEIDKTLADSFPASDPPPWR